MREPPEAGRDLIPLTDYELGYHRFPVECIACGEENVWPRGAVPEGDGNRRRCWSCHHEWVEV